MSTKLWAVLYNVLIANYWAWVLLGCVFIGLAVTGYLGWGWALFGVAVVWNMMRTSHEAKESGALSSYIVYLLLSDEIREKQKKGFQEWIHAEDAPNAMVLSGRALAAIQRLANGLAAGNPQIPLSSSTFGSHAMMWVEKGKKP